MWWGMKIKEENIDINEAIEVSNYCDFLLKRRDNNLLLSDYQIKVLNTNGINYIKYTNMHELLFDINYILQDNYQEELDLVASQIGEILYYSETKKWDNSHFLYIFFNYLIIFSWINIWSIFYFCYFVYSSYTVFNW